MVFPTLDMNAAADTRGALHAYARVLGAWCKTCHPRRKHWWHASLKPSLFGLTTGVIYADTDVELELSLTESLLVARNSTGDKRIEKLVGQPANSLAKVVQEFMLASGINESSIPELPGGIDGEFSDYSTKHAYQCGQVINAVGGGLNQFRGRITEETSPIQFWPHHFDLSML